MKNKEPLKVTEIFPTYKNEEEKRRSEEALAQSIFGYLLFRYSHPDPVQDADKRE